MRRAHRCSPAFLGASARLLTMIAVMCVLLFQAKPILATRFRANVAALKLTQTILSPLRCNGSLHHIAITGIALQCSFVREQFDRYFHWSETSTHTWLGQYELAIAYSLLGQLDVASRLLESSIEIMPPAKLARMARANVWFRQGQTANAIREWHSIGAWPTLNRFAQFYLKFPELRQQGFDYLNVVSQNGDTAAAGQALFLLASYSRNKGDTTAALPYLIQAIQHRPRETEYYFTLASALQEVRRFDEAITILQKAISIGDPPWRAELLAKLGDEYIYMGHYREATRAYEQAVNLAPNRTSWGVRLGSLYRRNSDLDRSLSRLLQAANHATGDDQARAYFELAQTYSELHQGALAVMSFEHAIQLAPEIPEFHAELGRCYVRLGRPSEALTAYRRALKLDSKNLEYAHMVDELQKGR